MTDLSKMTLKEAEDKGLIEKVNVDPKRLKEMGAKASMLGSIPVSIKILISLLALILIFGVINIPIWVWYFLIK